MGNVANTETRYYFRTYGVNCHIIRKLFSYLFSWQRRQIRESASIYLWTHQMWPRAGAGLTLKVGIRNLIQVSQTGGKNKSLEPSPLSSRGCFGSRVESEPGAGLNPGTVMRCGYCNIQLCHFILRLLRP